MDAQTFVSKQENFVPRSLVQAWTILEEDMLMSYIHKKLVMSEIISMAVKRDTPSQYCKAKMCIQKLSSVLVQEREARNGD